MKVCGIEVCQKPSAEGFAYCQDHLGVDVFHRCEYCGRELFDGDEVASSMFLGLVMANYHPACWELTA